MDFAQGPVPGPGEGEPGGQGQASRRRRSLPSTQPVPLLAEAPRRFAGGTHRVVMANEFPISMTMSGAIFELSPGDVRDALASQR